jgi:hypothetical protein
MITAIIVVTATIALLLAYATTRPGRFQVQRALSINTSVERIVPFIDDLRRSTVRSPSVLVRPSNGGPVDAERGRHSPADGAPGRVEIIGAELSGLAARLITVRPLAALNCLALTLEPQGDAIRVTWVTAGEVRFAGKLLRVFFDVDAMIGRTFEAYLADLKTLAE